MKNKKEILEENELDAREIEDECYNDMENDNRKDQEQLDQEEDDEMIADAERGQY